MPIDNPATLVEECVVRAVLLSLVLNSTPDSKKLVNSTVSDENYLPNSNEMYVFIESMFTVFPPYLSA